MDRTRIEWTDATWNPVRGCSRISEGCRNCFAESMAHRFSGPGLPFERLTKISNGRPTWTGEVRLVEDALALPLRWRRPLRVFVNSMSDLFHENLPDSSIDQVLSIILANAILEGPKHSFQVLTKREKRMRKYFSDRTPAELVQAWARAGDLHVQLHNEDQFFSELVYSATCRDWDENGTNSSKSEYVPFGYLNRVFPLPNLWLGVSVENQDTANERIPELLQTPAAKRFASYEPALGPIDLESIHWPFKNLLGRPHFVDVLRGGFWTSKEDPYLLRANAAQGKHPSGFVNHSDLESLDWVIMGGESGPGARPMYPEWARSMRDQCAAANVPFFFKQWGEWAPGSNVQRDRGEVETAIYFNSSWRFSRENLATHNGFVDDEPDVYKIGKQEAGRLLDGVEYGQFPEVGEK